MSKDRRPRREPQRSGQVSLSEALERLLPYCVNNPHKVASRLDAQHREREVRLLGGDVPMAPASNPAMLGISTRVLPDGEPVLFVQMRDSFDRPMSVWDGKMASLEQHRQFWTFERESFEAHFPGKPKNRGGQPRRHDREMILTEMAVAIFEDGLPQPLTLAGLCAMAEDRLGDDSPGLSTLKEILGPLFRMLEASINRSDSR
jgi:hypothetical protein